MKILLCQSYLGANSGEPLVFPLGLAYLASMVKESHELYCWDPNTSENPMEGLSAILDKLDPDVVGVSLRNIDNAFSFNVRSYYPHFAAMIKIIKEKAPSCKLIAGGGGFSLFSEHIMKRNPEIDFGIIGEGETSFSQLMKSLDKPERIENLVLRKNGKIFYTGQGKQVDFDLLPLPSRELFDLTKYKEKPYSIGIQSKRGCNFNCTFCSNTFFMGRTCRLRSPKKVVDEIEEATNKYGLNSFYFVDSVFNFPFDHTRKICNEIIRRNLDITWQADFRPEPMNVKFMKEAVQAGCQLFSFSPDGASNESLRSLGKGFTVEDVERTFDAARRVEGAEVAYSFFYDLPANNRENALGLLRLVPKILLKCPFKTRFVSFTRIRIYPHTMIYKSLIDQGKIGQEDDLICPVHYGSKRPANMSSLLPRLLRGSSIIFQSICKKLAVSQKEKNLKTGLVS